MSPNCAPIRIFQKNTYSFAVHFSFDRICLSNDFVIYRNQRKFVWRSSIVKIQCIEKSNNTENSQLELLNRRFELRYSMIRVNPNILV